jgi:hypothetical protein
VRVEWVPQRPLQPLHPAGSIAAPLLIRPDSPHSKKLNLSSFKDQYDSTCAQTKVMLSAIVWTVLEQNAAQLCP